MKKLGLLIVMGSGIVLMAGPVEDAELIDAAAGCELPRVKAALAAGANINSIDGERGGPALLSACVALYREESRKLRKNSANCFNVAEYLVVQGADPLVENPNTQFSAFSFARSKYHSSGIMHDLASLILLIDEPE